MKHFLKKILILSIFTSFLYSCKDESKIAVDFGAPNPAGNFVTADITSSIIDGNDVPNGKFDLTVDAPAHNVAKYTMNVRRITPDNVTTPFVELLSVESFPSNISISTQILADAFGIQVSDLNLGDTFEFLNSSVSSIDGTVVTANDLDNDLLSETGQKQAYKLKTQIICPIPSNYAVGTYHLTVVSSTSGFAPPFLEQDVEVSPLIVSGSESVYQRTFSVNYLEQFGIGQPNMDFIFEYFCGNLNAAENQNTHLGCGGTINLQPSDSVPYSLNFDDDNEIIINFVEGLGAGGCGDDGDSTIKLTKIN